MATVTAFNGGILDKKLEKKICQLEDSPTIRSFRHALYQLLIEFGYEPVKKRDWIHLSKRNKYVRFSIVVEKDNKILCFDINNTETKPMSLEKLKAYGKPAFMICKRNIVR